MSEHDEMEPNKPALAVLAVAGLLLALSITTMLVVPGLQPKYYAPTQVSGPVPSSPSGPSPQVVAGVTSYIIAPAGAGLGGINFQPANFVLVIGVNNTLVLKNEDTADHTVTSLPGDAFSFDTGDISGLSSSLPIVFTTPGVFPYQCQFHPAFMHGTITVLASPTSSGSSSS